ncbi:MAG TPA: TIGR03560 family F420-dependent LLM class oxidoreductase [Actinomycetota bacterium]
MKICLMVEGQENVTWDQWLALAGACEQLGFDAMFRSDHYTSLSNRETPEGTLDAWATLAALSGHTSTLRMGTLVSPVTFRHPSVLAKQVVTADHATGGRVELGMGAGWNEHEHRAFGFPFPPARERFSILEEQVEIVHRLWDRDEDEVTFEGSHYRLEACRAFPKPVADPHPRLIIGGDAGPRSAALAARWADEYNLTFEPPQGVAAARARLDAACEAAGRDPATLPLSMMTLGLFGSDRAELEARAARLLKLTRNDRDPAGYVDAGGREGAVVGTPDQVMQRLSELSGAGLARIMFQHLLHDDLDAVALIGEQLIPAAAGV